MNTWAWTFGDGNTSSLQNPSHTYTFAGSYTVKLVVSSSGGCSDSVTKTIFVDSTCVWPRDVNNDKTADTNDVLYIGIAYGETGAKRTNASTTWEGQYCDNWAKKFSNGANHKHADCNGDGVVDSNDISVVNRNWGDTHLKTVADKTGNPANPPFYLSFSKTTYNPGDTVKAEMMLGTSANPLSNVHGMASAFNFDLAYVDTNTLKINFSKSWFGVPGTDMLYFTHPEYKNGSLPFAITLIDHKNASGNGSLGTVSFVIPKNATVCKSVNFEPGPSKLIAFNESIVPVYLPSDTFSVSTATGIQNGSNGLTVIKLYPNPANTTLNIDAGENLIRSLVIIDATGKQIYEEQNISALSKSITVSGLSSGEYIIKIGTDSGSHAVEFMKR